MKKAKFVCEACDDCRCVIKTTVRNFVAAGMKCPFSPIDPQAVWVKVR